MTYKQWITKQIKSGWQPPAITEEQLAWKATQTYQAYLRGK